MKKQFKFLFFCALIISAFPDYVPAQIKKSEVPFAERKIRLSWEEVAGAISYKVMIKDQKGNVIINQDTDSNYIILEIPPADYMIRIGSINKFSKIGSWSDWADITIEKPGPIIKEEVPKAVSKSDSYLGLKIMLGVSYFYILPDWNKYYKNSYNGYSIDIAYSFKNINFPGSLVFFKHTGLEIESNYVKFDGKKDFNKVESDITNIISGVNFFIRTNNAFPLNFILRGGGGMALTEQKYKKYDLFGNPVDKGTSTTSDFFYKAGISMEYRIFSGFFLEAYADYYAINYLIKEFRCLRFSCQAGMKI